MTANPDTLTPIPVAEAASVGMNSAALAEFAAALKSDIANRVGDGAVALIARHGRVVFHESFGVTDAGDATRMRLDAVFNILSLTKAFTNLLVFQAIERGRILLTSSVAQIVPEFAGFERENITVLHLLTHTSGLPPVIAPIVGPDAAVLDRVVEAIARTVKPIAPAGIQVSYSPSVGHALLADIVRRTDPKHRSFRSILQEDVLDPLGMKDTSLGLRRDLADRHVPLRFLAPSSGIGGQSNVLVPQMWQEDAEMPWVGAVSTVHDLFLFTEMLRQGGTSNGRRLVSPAMLRMATQNHTGERPNNLYSMFSHARGWGDLPAYIGLGFFLRGASISPNRFGNLATSSTYGHTGAGSSLFWIDPERGLTFICLSAGLLEEGDNFVRFSRLSDMVSASVEVA